MTALSVVGPSRRLTESIVVTSVPTGWTGILAQGFCGIRGGRRLSVRCDGWVWRPLPKGPEAAVAVGGGPAVGAMTAAVGRGRRRGALVDRV